MGQGRPTKRPVRSNRPRADLPWMHVVGNQEPKCRHVAETEKGDHQCDIAGENALD